MKKFAPKLRITVPRDLIIEASQVAPRSLRRDPSRIVGQALRAWIDERKEHLIDLAIERMGKDPQVIADCRKINKEFERCDADGLTSL